MAAVAVLLHHRLNARTAVSSLVCAAAAAVLQVRGGQAHEEGGDKGGMSKVKVTGPCAEADKRACRGASECKTTPSATA